MFGCLGMGKIYMYLINIHYLLVLNYYGFFFLQSLIIPTAEKVARSFWNNSEQIGFHKIQKKKNF